MFKSAGYLFYDPVCDGQKVIEPFWLILRCDSGLAAYYRNRLFWRHFVKLAPSGWGSHVSVIRSERPTKGRWGLGRGRTVEFEYEPIVKTNGKHFWLPVKCELLLDLRESYGLKRGYGLHLTIGSTKEDVAL